MHPSGNVTHAIHDEDVVVAEVQFVFHMGTVLVIDVPLLIQQVTGMIFGT
jgi:hypothetical protein